MRNDAFRRFECHVYIVLIISLELPRLGENTLLGNQNLKIREGWGGIRYANQICKLEPP